MLSWISGHKVGIGKYASLVGTTATTATGTHIMPTIEAFKAANVGIKKFMEESLGAGII